MMIECDELEKCYSEYSDKKKTLKDKKGGKSRLHIDNPSGKKFKIVDIENCIYKGLENETKCDYGILDETTKTFCFVELKGCDVDKGIKQLLESLNEIKNCINAKHIKAILVITRFPSPKSTYNTKEYKNLVKAVKENLVIKISHTETI